MCHTRELAFQISKEYERFSKYMNTVKIAVFFGGMLVTKDQETLRNNCPHIVVGTPGRILALVRTRHLNLKNLKHFVLDECDKMLDQLGETTSLLLLGRTDYCYTFLSSMVCPFSIGQSCTVSRFGCH